MFKYLKKRITHISNVFILMERNIEVFYKLDKRNSEDRKKLLCISCFFFNLNIFEIKILYARHNFSSGELFVTAIPTKATSVSTIRSSRERYKYNIRVVQCPSQDSTSWFHLIMFEGS